MPEILQCCCSNFRSSSEALRLHSFQNTDIVLLSPESEEKKQSTHFSKSTTRVTQPLLPSLPPQPPQSQSDGTAFKTCQHSGPPRPSTTGGSFAVPCLSTAHPNTPRSSCHPSSSFHTTVVLQKLVCIFPFWINPIIPVLISESISDQSNGQACPFLHQTTISRHIMPLNLLLRNHSRQVAASLLKTNQPAFSLLSGPVRFVAARAEGRCCFN